MRIYLPTAGGNIPAGINLNMAQTVGHQQKAGQQSVSGSEVNLSQNSPPLMTGYLCPDHLNNCGHI